MNSSGNSVDITAVDDANSGVEDQDVDKLQLMSAACTLDDSSENIHIKKLRELVDVESGRLEETTWRKEMGIAVNALSSRLKFLEARRRKGEKVAQHNIRLQQINEELEKKIQCLENNQDMDGDNEDGRKQDEETEKTAGNVLQNKLPSLSNKYKLIHQKFRNPFNCPASCVLSTIFYVVTLITKKKLCSVKFTKEIHLMLDVLSRELVGVVEEGDDEVVDEVFGEFVDEGGNKQSVVHHENEDEDQECRKCSWSVDDLKNLELIDERAVYCSRNINGVHELDEFMQIAAEVMRQKKVYIALIIVEYKEESAVGSHCMAIRLYKDKVNSAVCAEVFDAQSGTFWQENDKHLDSVLKFRIHNIEKAVAVKFVEKCKVALCTEERRMATSADQATGVLDEDFFRYLESSEFFTYQQVEAFEED